MTQQEQRAFIERIGNAAAVDMTKSGVLASLKIAQAILESGWGRSTLATKANALFGIKADSRWSGRVFNIDTQEVFNGVQSTVNANFRAYNSWEESNADHTAFLTASARYAAVIGERDYKAACRAIHAAGYATDPTYPDKLIRIIEQHNLTAFDTAATNGGNTMSNTQTNAPALNIIQDFVPAGRRNRPGRVNPMLFVTIHETGNTSRGSGARNHANYLKGDTAANLPVSWHYTTDDKETYQHLPENEDGFHAGDGGGNGNRQSIGIEMCVNSDGDFAKTIDRTAALTADICRRRNIPVENVRQHNNWSGKNCPQNIRAGRPITWGAFIDRVRAYMGQTPATPPTAPTTPTAPAAPSTDYKVGDVVQFTGGGVYTSSTAHTPAHSRDRSRCKVTQIAPRARNQYHLISEDGGRVHGWVVSGDVTAIGQAPAPTPPPATPSQPATTPPSTPALLPLDAIAREVINGRWGNGAERVQRLTVAGYDAAAVQRRVNELLK